MGSCRLKGKPGKRWGGSNPFVLARDCLVVADASGKKPTPDIDVEAFLTEAKRQLAELGKQFKATADKVADEAQFVVDRELARALAKHPDLYAEVRKTLRQIKKTADKTAEAFGLKPE
jgi:hypothetical protein